MDSPFLFILSKFPTNPHPSPLPLIRTPRLFGNQEYKNISPVGCRPGILYGQAKVQKTVINNCPSFRPILDAINTTSYKLAKFFVTVLSPLSINEYTVNNSFAFAKEITKTNCNYLMAILDVESLFTNIPLEETIENCVNDLFFDKYKIDNLTKQDVHDLLSAAGKESFIYLFFFFLTKIFIVK